MKKLKYLFASVLLVASATSCSDYLNVTPENSQVSDDYWQTQEDVENVMISGYYYLRSAVEGNLIPWGESRAGLIYNSKGNRLQSWQMTSSDGLCDWSNLYKCINVANTVLARANEACINDATYTESERNSHYTEAYFIRALSYFYLVRNWRDVPLALEPFENDSYTFNLPKTSESMVVMQIKADILAALKTGAAKEAYGTTWETKGRATKWALYALMADVCLWSEDYETAITYCDALLNTQSPQAPAFLSTPSRATWFSMFNPGNSNESIFELQWNYEEDQSNNLPILFDDVLSGGIYRTSPEITSEILAEYATFTTEDGIVLKESVRTDHAGFYSGAQPTSYGYVWKYLGSTTKEKKRTAIYYDPNFIIYRMAEVILMKAEAELLIESNPSPARKLEAVKLINKIRVRAGLEDNIEETEDDADMYSQEELLEKVLDERKIELLGEGKIWYDFLRMGRSNGNRYRSAFLVEQVVKYDTQASESWIRSVLNSDNALYLPILADEINRNPLLIQNDYYK